MKKTKRLFLFAGYDKDGIIDDTLVYYLTELSKLGDIVLVMDCDVADATKLSGIKNILHTELARHNEYDFGSYKRGYIWAHDNKILDKYDWVYLVNDSVYGPLWNLEKILNTLESSKSDFTGMIDHFTKNIDRHIQSWFVGFSNKISKDSSVKHFLEKVKHEPDKDLIIIKYEYGLTRMLLNRGYTFNTYIQEKHPNVHSVYETPFQIITQGLPFIKKSVISKSSVLTPLLQYMDEDMVQHIYDRAPNRQSRYNTTVDIENVFRITFFSVPILRIRRYKFSDCNTVNYKILLFDIIPITKISLTK